MTNDELAELSRSGPTQVASRLDQELDSDSFYRDPYPTYAQLRSREPVFWSESWNCWLVTRFDDADAILRDTSRFSNADRFDGLLGELAGRLPEQAGLEPLVEHCKLGVANVDRPEHSRLRALMGHGFRPRDVASLEQNVEVVVQELLDDVSGAEFDLVGALASPLPAIVIANALGVPADDRFRFKTLIDGTLFHGTGQAMLDRALGAVAALRSLDDWLGPMIRERRVEPRDDLLTRLVLAREQGDLLSASELVTSCIVLVRAGQLTTQGLLGNGVLALLRDRAQWEKLVADPNLAGNAVEEMLRYDTSFLRTLRRATADTVVRGKHVAENELISVMLGAANRDPERHADPDRFDIGRDDTKHLGFGVGTHFCLGAALARLEVATALRALAERWPQLRLSDSVTVTWERDNVNRHLRALHVRT